MELEWGKLLFLMVAGFAAAFVDAVAGGGGLISVPAFFLAGFPSHLALGTNKLSMTFGTLTSTINYYRNGKADLSLLKSLVPCALFGAVLGVLTVLRIEADILKPIVMVLLIVVGIYTSFSKQVGMIDHQRPIRKKEMALGMLFALAMGFYYGFFGPGTGSFIIFGLIAIYGFDFVRASGNAKAINMSSGLAALITFAVNGKIVYSYAFPIAITMILGGYVGSRVALKKGAVFIKPIFIVMAIGAAVKMLVEAIF